MSTLDHSRSRHPAVDLAVGKVGAAIGVLTALAVAVLFLVLLAGGSKPAAQAVPASSQYAPLIQYRGTGAPPAAMRAPVAPASLQRAEHGYGLVP